MYGGWAKEGICYRHGRAFAGIELTTGCALCIINTYVMEAFYVYIVEAIHDINYLQANKVIILNMNLQEKRRIWNGIALCVRIPVKKLPELSTFSNLPIVRIRLQPLQVIIANKASVSLLNFKLKLMLSFE